MARILFFILFATTFFTKVANAASFDCAKARTKIEKIICRDAELSDLDGRMAKAYDFYRTIHPDKVEKITEEQKNLPKYREKLIEKVKLLHQIEILREESKQKKLTKLLKKLEKLEKELKDKYGESGNEDDLSNCARLYTSNPSACYLSSFYKNRINNLTSPFEVVPELKKLTEILDSIIGEDHCSGSYWRQVLPERRERSSSLLALSVTSAEPSPIESYDPFLKTWSKQGIYERKKYLSFKKTVAQVNESLKNHYITKFNITPEKAAISATNYTNQIFWSYASGVYISEEETCNTSDLNEFMKTEKMPARCNAMELTRIAILYEEPKSVVQKLLAATPKKELAARTTDLLSFSANRPEITKLLIKFGAKVNNSQTVFGKTALMYSIQERDLENIKILVQAGAKVNQPTRAIPSDEDKNKKRDEKVQEILKDQEEWKKEWKKDKGYDWSLEEWCRHTEGCTMRGYAGVPSDLWRKFLDEEAKRNEKKEAEKRERGEKDVDHVKKSDDDYWNDENYWNYNEWCSIGAGNRTPLMYAAWHGTPEIIKFLIKSGADPKLKDSNGETAYDYLSKNHLDEKDLAEAQKLLKI
jgi:uncharacterized protein YecT (DUF1311 family)